MTFLTQMVSFLLLDTGEKVQLMCIRLRKQKLVVLESKLCSRSVLEGTKFSKVFSSRFFTNTQQNSPFDADLYVSDNGKFLLKQGIIQGEGYINGTILDQVLSAENALALNN